MNCVNHQNHLCNFVFNFDIYLVFFIFYFTQPFLISLLFLSIVSIKPNFLFINGSTPWNTLERRSAIIIHYTNCNHNNHETIQIVSWAKISCLKSRGELYIGHEPSLNNGGSKIASSKYWYVLSFFFRYILYSIKFESSLLV